MVRLNYEQCVSCQFRMCFVAGSSGSNMAAEVPNDDACHGYYQFVEICRR